MSRSGTTAIHQEPRMRSRSPGTWARMGMLACAALVLTRCAPPQQPPADSAAVRAGRVELGSPEGGDCSSLRFDLRRGTLNGLSPQASMEQVKARLDCSTGETEEGEPINYGGGVFFLDHDMYFYTHRDFIEVRARFPGTVAPDLLGASRAAAAAALGEPIEVAGTGHLLFRAPYGCARVLLDAAGMVTQVAAHARPCEDVPADIEASPGSAPIPFVFPGRLPRIPPRDEWTDATELSGVWRGSYVCAQGETGLELTLEGSASGEVRGAFRFFPLPSNPNARAGSYRMRGAYARGGRLVLEGAAWIDAPPDYMMVGLEGKVTAGGRQFTGTVPECDAPFRVSRDQAEAVPAPVVPRTD